MLQLKTIGTKVGTYYKTKTKMMFFKLWFDKSIKHKKCLRRLQDIIFLIYKIVINNHISSKFNKQ